MSEFKSVILFDGVCCFCEKWVYWVIRNDPSKHFRFAALESKVGEQLLERVHLFGNLKTLVLIKEGQVATESTAVLRILSELGGMYRLASILFLVPRFLRDGVYRWVARHRYQWFGKRQKCFLPTPQIQERFLSDGSV